MRVPCVMCGKHKGRVEKHMKKEHFLKCLAYLRTCTGSVALHGIGEPLCYPGLLDLIEDPGSARLCFNTNGLLLDERVARQLVRKKVAAVNVSIDAAEPATYLRIRHNSLERVKANLRRLAEIKKQKKSALPRVTVNMCLMKENVREMAAFVDLAAETGAAAVLFFPMNPVMEPNIRWEWFDYAAQHVSDLPELHDRCVLAAEARAAALGIEFVYNGRKYLTGASGVSWHGRGLPETCPAAFGNVLVDTDGGVRLCCHMKGPVGHLDEDSLEAAYNGPLAAEIRERISAGAFHEYCMSEDCVYYREYRDAALQRLPERLGEAERAARSLGRAAAAWKAGVDDTGGAMLPAFTMLLAACDALLNDLAASGRKAPESLKGELITILRGFMHSAAACVRSRSAAAVNRVIAREAVPLLAQFQKLLDACSVGRQIKEAVCA